MVSNEPRCARGSQLKRNSLAVNHMPSITEAIQELDKVHTVLRADLGAANSLRVQADTPYARRQFVRSGFAWIEGVVYRLKQVTLQVYEGSAVPLPRQTACALAEDSFDLTDDGKVRPRLPNTKTLPNLRFAFRSFLEAFHCSHKPDYGGTGFQALQSSLALRHRLTHPKSTGDLEVSEDAIGEAILAFDWFLGEMRAILQAAQAAVLSWMPPEPPRPEDQDIVG
jgi:hypothetical protein